MRGAVERLLPIAAVIGSDDPGRVSRKRGQGQPRRDRHGGMGDGAGEGGQRRVRAARGQMRLERRRCDGRVAGQGERCHEAAPISAAARATMASRVMPNFSYSTSAGAEAPKPSIPITSSSEAT